MASAAKTGGAAGISVTGGTAGTTATGGAVGTGGTATGGTTTSGGTANSGGASAGGALATNPGANGRFSQAKQVIDGFGVSTAWLYPPQAAVKTAVDDVLFSVSNGAGLSLVRNRIPFRENPSNDDKFINKNADGTYQYTTNSDGSKTSRSIGPTGILSNTSSLISDIKAAGADYQVTKFMSTPWTPPNNSVSKWKISDSYKTIDYINAPEVGGGLDPTHYADYADVLADYLLGYKAKMGVDLSVLSLQNEPSFQCTYESCDWTAAQLHELPGNAEYGVHQEGCIHSVAHPADHGARIPNRDRGSHRPHPERCSHFSSVGRGGGSPVRFREEQRQFLCAANPYRFTGRGQTDLDD